MQQITLTKRSTFRYASGWNYLEKWSDVGTAKFTPLRKVRDAGSELESGPTFVTHAVIPRGQDVEASQLAIEQTLSGTSCRHEYDCCGCVSTRAIASRAGRRRFLVRIYHAYNF